MNVELKSYDAWLSESGPAAFILREYLMPVEGQDGVLFPATFAASEDKTFKGGYNIDEFPDGSNICLIDTVGSQANRIEPIFATKGYSSLVPQIVVTAGERRINLLAAGHRAADAIVRCSTLQEDLRSAFKFVLAGNCEPLAKIAPTSLVFGAWDSRDTQAKLPRLVASTVRAFDIRRLTRSAQYVPSAQYIEQELLDEPADKKTKDSYAERGFIHVPASSTHGGVIATGGIRREASLHLAALRLLSGADEPSTVKLRRYIFGLALTAFTLSTAGYLRQGCSLVRDPEKRCELHAVYPDGRRDPVTVTHTEALSYAKLAASAFGIDIDRTVGTKPDQVVAFDKELAQRDITGDSKTARKAKGQKKEDK